MLWQVLSTEKDILKALLKNRRIETKKEREEFFHPTDPMKISLKSLGIKESEVKRAIDRIIKAKKSKEKVIIYGDYDADGICATAILWETLYSFGLKVLPYIPERFSEGYGLNSGSIKKLKEKDPELKLIITVDHGIVADKKVDFARELGIDVIVTDHHQKGKTIPKAHAIIHTDKISGSGISWIFSREISKDVGDKLELAAIGTIADQLPLTGPNRSIVKYGLKRLNRTKRPGLLALFAGAGIKNEIGPYEVGFLIAPRINSMGRLEHAVESLRLLCTGNKVKAGELARHMNSTNSERQRIVDEVVTHALSLSKGEVPNVIVLAHEKYHEGVIGLAAARLTEEFYRPAIVLSKKGEISKASARSISGFNIIEAIRSLEDLYIEGGGHPMAAGFSIETKNIDKFAKKINAYAKKFLTKDILSKRLKIDLDLNFSYLNWELYKKIWEFEPTGLGNPGPTFSTKNVEVLDLKTVGQMARHLKLKLKQNGHIFDAIYFGGGEIYSSLTPDSKIDVVYQLEDNTWNGHKSLQLKIRDLKID